MNVCVYIYKAYNKTRFKVLLFYVAKYNPRKISKH